MARRKHICMISCGGTIAMAKNPETGVLEPAKSPEELLAMVPKVRPLVELDLVDLFNIPSSNMTIEYWQKIIEAVNSRYRDYDGFIITHGTDTMANTGAALSLALGNKVNKPIVLTGSQAPPDVIGSDAAFNLENAFRVVASDFAEVMITFGHYVMRASRTVKVSESEYNAFRSPAIPPLAVVKPELEWFPGSKKIAPFDEELVLKSEFDHGVLNMSLGPGLSPNLVASLINSEELTGIVFESLGAGNVPDGFIPVIREAISRGVPVVVTSPFIGGYLGLRAMDLTGVAAIRAGAIPCGDMTSVMAPVKLMWSLAQIEKEIEKGKAKETDKISLVSKMMQHPFVGEITPE